MCRYLLNICMRVVCVSLSAKHLYKSFVCVSLSVKYLYESCVCVVI